MDRWFQSERRALAREVLWQFLSITSQVYKSDCNTRSKVEGTLSRQRSLSRCWCAHATIGFLYININIFKSVLDCLGRIAGLSSLLEVLRGFPPLSWPTFPPPVLFGTSHFTTVQNHHLNLPYLIRNQSDCKYAWDWKSSIFKDILNAGLWCSTANLQEVSKSGGSDGNSL